MYEKIKNDIAQEYYVKNYPNDGQRFVAWYLRNIHNLDTFEAKACITDGAGDKQRESLAHFGIIRRSSSSFTME